MTNQNGIFDSRETARLKSTGYQMIRTLSIENFRGIERATIDNLKRINVVVGPNGTGKTALLEAVYLAGGNSPENLLKSKQWRGRELGEIQGDLDTIQAALWSDTFRDPSLGEARVAITDTSGDVRSVEIRKTRSAQIFSPDGDSRLAHMGMTFVWEGPHGRNEVVPQISPQGLKFEPVPAGPGVHFLPARMNVSEAETARAYSRLSVDGDPKLFVDAFRNEFEFLHDIAIEAPIGPPALYARMANGRKLPLTMISGGVAHLAGMMVRMAANPRSVLLVDEIENGLYHDRYESIWRSLFELAEHSDSQVIATSHSLECLRALTRALPDKADQVSFARSRLENNEVQFEQFSGPVFYRAVELGEVR
jgi:hypothetical protein